MKNLNSVLGTFLHKYNEHCFQSITYVCVCVCAFYSNETEFYLHYTVYSDDDYL